jgi:hypothetical protein
MLPPSLTIQTNREPERLVMNFRAPLYPQVAVQIGDTLLLFARIVRKGGD